MKARQISVYVDESGHISVFEGDRLSFGLGFDEAINELIELLHPKIAGYSRISIQIDDLIVRSMLRSARLGIAQFERANDDALAWLEEQRRLNS